MAGPPPFAPGCLAPDRPALDWSAPSGPRSATFNDVYFSASDGLAESRAVFIDGCRLSERLSSLQPGDHAVVAELGFGSGLNFLALWALWRAVRPPNTHLHFVSIEAAPLTATELARAHAPWPELNELSTLLRSRLPPPIKGVHARRLDREHLSLTVAYLPVDEALDALEVTADAWFLDGFAPARNAAMWSPHVLAAVGARTKPGGRAATYTVAGAVRRGLEAAGFAVAKRPGFGGKRERLEALRLDDPPCPPSRGRRGPHYPAALGVRPATAFIVGAGLAGAHLAVALSQRGVRVSVLDADGPASGASGNPAGLVMPRVDLDDRAPARLHRAAYAFALNAYAEDPTWFEPTGVCALTPGKEDRDWADRAITSGALPPDWLTWDSDKRGLTYANAGIARPATIVADLLAKAGATPTLAHIHRLETSDQFGARAFTPAGDLVAEADIAIVCAGPTLARFPQTRALTIRPSRGQISFAEPVRPARPPSAITFGGYAANVAGKVMFGATYAPHDGDTPVTASDHDNQSNWDMLKANAPAWTDRLDRASVTGRASVRATTPDRLPVLGPMIDADAFAVRFAGLRTGMRDQNEEPAALHPQLYVFGGLGSRGLTLAPLLAQALAAELCGEPGMLERGGAIAIHPARDLVRALKRGQA